MAIHPPNDPPKILEILSHNLKTYLQVMQPQDFKIRSIEVNYNPEMEFVVVTAYLGTTLGTGFGPTLNEAIANSHEKVVMEFERKAKTRPTPPPLKGKAKTTDQLLREKLGISFNDLFS